MQTTNDKIKRFAKMAERWTVDKRVRDLAEAPDGTLWMIEDANPGALVHITPK